MLEACRGWGGCKWGYLSKVVDVVECSVLVLNVPLLRALGVSVISGSTSYDDRAHPQPSLAAPQTLKILVSHGCDPNRPSHNGTTPLVIATANEHHSVMMHLIVECGVDPVLNDDTQEKPDDNSPEEEVDVYENSGQNTLFWALTAGEGDDHAGAACCAELVWKG